MPTLDDRLRRELREAALSSEPDAIFTEVSHRRRRRAARRRLTTVTLSLAVVARASGRSDGSRCGSVTMPRRSPGIAGEPVPSTAPKPDTAVSPALRIDLCDPSTLTADVDGNERADLVATGTRTTSCRTDPTAGPLIVVERSDRGDFAAGPLPQDCLAGCPPFAAIDVTGDGMAELFVVEGRTAAPASALIGVYVVDFDQGIILPLRFPGGTNRFVLQNSSRGWMGASCDRARGAFTTWTAPSEAGAVDVVRFQEWSGDATARTFTLASRETVRTSELPGAGARGYDGRFCGQVVPSFG